jgi:predicted nucleotidyltransferase
MKPEIQGIVSELRQKLENLYGERLVHVVLFGSQSRGDAVASSDIDVMVVLKGEVSPGKEIVRIGEMTAELSLKYDVVVSCTFISTERYETEKSPLLLNVHREGVLV